MNIQFEKSFGAFIQYIHCDTNFIEILSNVTFCYLQHMIKYKYLPFTHGKPKYQNHEDISRLISK